MAHGRGLKRGWGPFGTAFPPAQGAGRGALERLIGEDPETGETIDLGQVIPFARRVTIIAPASQANSGTLSLPTKYGLLILSLRAVATDARWTFSAGQLEGNVTRPWQDRAVRSELLFGTGVQPLYFFDRNGRGPGAFLLPPGSNTELIVADLSAASNAIHLIFEGLRIPAEMADLRRFANLASETPFIKSTTFTVPASASMADVAIDAHGGVPFDLHYINCSVTSGASRVQASGFNINLRGGNDNRDLFDEEQPIESVSGLAVTPGGLTLPWGLEANERIIVKATNRTAGAITPELALIGTKVWR